MNIIINNKEDYYLVKKKYENSKIYIENIKLYLELENDDNEYLYDYLHQQNLNEFNNDLSNFYLNWYRDENQIDYTSKDNISFAQILHKKISLNFSYDFKIYLCIKNIIKTKNKIYFIKNSSKSLERLKNTFPESIEYLQIDNNLKDSFELSYNNPERALFSNPPTNKIFYILRLFQALFKFLLLGKVLYEVDWSSKKYFSSKSKNILFKSHKNLFKSYYHLLNHKYLIKYDEIAPKNFDFSLFNYNYLLTKINFKKINSDNKLINHFIYLVKKEFIQSRSKIINYLAYYHDIMIFYKPRKIIISGQSSFINISAIQIAKLNNVKIEICLDGYQTNIFKLEWLKSKNNTNYLFDKYYASGRAHYELLNKKLNIDKNNIQLIKAPIISNLKSTKKNIEKIRYDAMILSYSCYLEYTFTYWDSQLETECEIIHVLAEAGFKKLAVKFKNGSQLSVSQNIRTIKNYNQFLMKKYNKTLSDYNIKIDFIYNKELFEVSKFTNVIIGQISTAIIEAFYLNKSYYIYEPYRNGVTKNEIENSVILNQSNVIRNPEMLKKFIAKSTPFFISKDYLF